MTIKRRIGSKRGTKVTIHLRGAQTWSEQERAEWQSARNLVEEYKRATPKVSPAVLLGPDLTPTTDQGLAAFGHVDDHLLGTTRHSAVVHLFGRLQDKRDNESAAQMFSINDATADRYAGGISRRGTTYETDDQARARSQRFSCEARTWERRCE